MFLSITCDNVCKHLEKVVIEWLLIKMEISKFVTIIKQNVFYHIWMLLKESFEIY